MEQERRVFPRREFGYYMPVMEAATTKVIGYLADIGLAGIRMDTREKLALNKSYTLRLDLTPEVSDKPSIIFTARVKWTHPDTSDPESYMVGMKIVTMEKHDKEIFANIMEKYGRPKVVWN